jgi:hypothetical protein
MKSGGKDLLLHSCLTIVWPLVSGPRRTPVSGRGRTPVSGYRTGDIRTSE